MSERGRLGRASKYVQRGCVLLPMWSLQVRVRTPRPKRELCFSEADAPPDVESSGVCRGEGTSAEAMRYVSARLRASPDAEASGPCRGEDTKG